MKHDVFISYSRSDYMDENKQIIPGNIVTQIMELLDANNITYWFDEECIHSGDAFASVIARNIKESRMLLFVSTHNSNQSQWTSDEIAVAREYGKKIIPFRYDHSQYNEDVIIYIARLDYIDYMANPNAALTRLLSSIKETLRSESQKEIDVMRAEYERMIEGELREERAKRVEVIDDSVAKYNEELKSIEQDIIEHHKTLLELKFKRDKLNATLKELSAEKMALLCDVSVTCDEDEDIVVVESETFNIGDYYDDGVRQGVVFDVWDGGRHGKIVSLDQSKKLWCTSAQYGRRIAVNASSSTDGNANAKEVMYRSDIGEYPPFMWCRTKGEGWYLPAIEELKLLLLNENVSAAVNKTLEKQGATKLNNRIKDVVYWSSTESDELHAWCIHVYSRSTYVTFKSFDLYVRAVATF